MRVDRAVAILLMKLKVWVLGNFRVRVKSDSERAELKDAEEGEIDDRIRVCLGLGCCWL